MKVFLSYASDQNGLAIRIAHGLVQEGDVVFFDRESLPVGDGYHQRIRDAITGSDVFVFLVSPESIAHGSYAAAELEIAQSASVAGGLRVVPVMTAATDFASLPPFLGSITILQPRGDLVAVLLATAAEIRSDIKRRQVTYGIEVGNSGWMLTIHIIDPNPREILLSEKADGPFVSTGLLPYPNAETGLPYPNPSLMIPPFTGKAEIFVKYIDARGRERGPFRLELDPEQSVPALAKYALNFYGSWTEFWGDEERCILLFSFPLSYKHALQEIRYSLDDDSLSRQIRFKVDQVNLGIDKDDEVQVEIPWTTRSVSVQLTFIDGTKSALRRFPNHLRSAQSASAPQRPGSVPG